MNDAGDTSGRSCGVEALDYVTRSRTRLAVLEQLHEAGRVEERSLREAVPGTRTTVGRALDGFAERGWVDRSGGTAALTGFGEAMAVTTAEARSRLDAVSHLRPFLSRVPATELDLPLEALADATVTTAAEGEPYAAVERVTALRREADHVRELSSIIARESAEQARERAQAGEATFEIVLAGPVVERVREGRFADTVSETAAVEGVELYESPEAAPYLLALTDEAVALGVTNEENVPVCLVESRDERVLAWAETTFERYRDGSEPLEL